MGRGFIAVSHFLEHKMLEDFLTVSFPGAQGSGKVQYCQLSKNENVAFFI